MVAQRVDLHQLVEDVGAVAAPGELGRRVPRQGALVADGREQVVEAAEREQTRGGRLLGLLRCLRIEGHVDEHGHVVRTHRGGGGDSAVGISQQHGRHAVRHGRTGTTVGYRRRVDAATAPVLVAEREPLGDRQPHAVVGVVQVGEHLGLVVARADAVDERGELGRPGPG